MVNHCVNKYKVYFSLLPLKSLLNLKQLNKKEKVHRLICLDITSCEGKIIFLHFSISHKECTACFYFPHFVFLSFHACLPKQKYFKHFLFQLCMKFSCICVGNVNVTLSFHFIHNGLIKLVLILLNFSHNMKIQYFYIILNYCSYSVKLISCNIYVFTFIR